MKELKVILADNCDNMFSDKMIDTAYTVTRSNLGVVWSDQTVETVETVETIETVETVEID